MGGGELISHHGVRFNAIDENWQRAEPLLLHAFDELSDVGLVGDDVLAVEEHSDNGGGTALYRTVSAVPRPVLCGG